MTRTPVYFAQHNLLADLNRAWPSARSVSEYSFEQILLLGTYNIGTVVLIDAEVSKLESLAERGLVEILGEGSDARYRITAAGRERFAALRRVQLLYLFHAATRRWQRPRWFDLSIKWRRHLWKMRRLRQHMLLKKIIADGGIPLERFDSGDQPLVWLHPRSRVPTNPIFYPGATPPTLAALELVEVQPAGGSFWVYPTPAGRAGSARLTAVRQMYHTRRAAVLEEYRPLEG